MSIFDQQPPIPTQEDPNARKIGQSGNFKYFESGVGEKSFRITDEGVHIGGEGFASSPLKFDFNGKQIAGPNGEIVIDGPNGRIEANNIYDKTYGLYGIFAKQIKVTDYASNPAIVNIVPDSGGLLCCFANWYQPSTGRFNFLPGINNATGTSYWSIQKSGGYYQVRHLGANQASELPGPGYTTYTILFNSNEQISNY